MAMAMASAAAFDSDTSPASISFCAIASSPKYVAEPGSSGPIAAVVYGSAEANRYRDSSCPNSPTSPAATAVDGTGEISPRVSASRRTPTHATPPFSVTASTVDRSC